MTVNEKAGWASTLAASNTTFDKRRITSSEPFQGRFDLAKPACNGQQKKSWKRGWQQGLIDAYLLAELALLAAIMLLIVGGLIHA